MDHPRRARALWFGLASVGALELYSRWLAQEERIGALERAQSADPDEWREVDVPPSRRLRLVRQLRIILGGLIFSSLVANEISHVYCGGHTILGALALLLAHRLPPERAALCRRLLLFSIWWDGMWLSSDHPLLQDAYRTLIDAAAHLGDWKERKLYAKELRRLIWLERKEKVFALVDTATHAVNLAKIRLRQWKTQLLWLLLLLPGRSY